MVNAAMAAAGVSNVFMSKILGRMRVWASGDHRVTAHQSIQPRCDGGSGSGAILRPSRTGAADQCARLATLNGASMDGEMVSTVISAAHPAMTMQPSDISLHGDELLPDLSGHMSQSDMPAIAPDVAAARSCCIIGQGAEAKATPCPARPRMTPRSRRWRSRNFILTAKCSWGG